MNRTPHKGARLIDLPQAAGGAIDCTGGLPFTAKAVATLSGAAISDCKGACRRLNRVLVCPAGQVTVTVEDDGQRQVLVLSSPVQGLFVPAGLWLEVSGGAGAVLVVSTDGRYQDSDLITDHAAFQSWRQSRLAPFPGALKVNVGCGGHPLAGYVNIDMDSLDDLRRRYPGRQFADDLVLEPYDVLNLPFEDGSVEEVNADSFIEHLRFSDEPIFFNEIKRILKPGGRFVFSTPDFEEVARMFLEAKDDWRDFYRTDDEAITFQHWFGTYSPTLDNRWGYLTATIFGSQNGEGQFHTNCYTEAKIRAVCARIGLVVTEVSRFRWRGDRDPMVAVVAVKEG